MEFITAEHLEKYETILQKIDKEYELCKQLEKQIKGENDKIVAANIALHENTLRNKLFKVNVRVFDSIFEIFDYGASISNTLEDLVHCKNCRFYLVEVYVSTIFQDKLADQKWILNVKISSSNRILSQSLNLKNKAFTYPLIVILPLDSSERNCLVETALVLPSKNFWTSIKLENVCVNISHYFKVNNESISNTRNVTMDIINICKCYCKNPNVLQSLIAQNNIEATFQYNNNVSDLLKYLMWNCYHRVDPEVYAALEKSKSFSFEIKIDNLDSNKFFIVFNSEENILKIKASINLMYEIKKYFIEGTNEKQISLNRRTFEQFTVCRY